ncbi:MAG: hypothetical protein ABIR15_21725 [Chitinophagaceae bacterium]
MKSLNFICLTLFCIPFFFACSKTDAPPPAPPSPPSLLVGNWNEVSEADSIFAPGGAVVYDSTFLLSHTDSWSFKANGTDSLVSTIGISSNFNTMVFTIFRGASLDTGRFVVNGDVILRTSGGKTTNINIQHLTADALVLSSTSTSVANNQTYTFTFQTRWERK